MTPSVFSREYNSDTWLKADRQNLKAVYMIKRLRIFLGPQRLWIIFFLLAFTGLASLILNAVIDEVSWARQVQNVLALTFVIGTVVVIGTRLDAYDRGRWIGILAPSLLALIIGVLILPQFFPLLIGAAIGWILAGLLIFRARGPMQYREAVKHLRKNAYAEAVKAMDQLIKEEPDRPNHYRFRAEILRVWGKLDRARRDYEKMTRIAETEEDRAVAFNGLAEVLLQMENFEKAHEAAIEAYELAPGEWVAAYNLGMIEDRLKDADSTIEHLNLALDAKVPDARHRLLIHFYLARAYARQGNMDEAQKQVKWIHSHQSGLNEWQMILSSDQAETLRAVLEADIQAAEALAYDQMTVQELAT